MYVSGQHKIYSKQDKDRSDPQSKKVSVEFLQSIDPQYHLAIPLNEQPEQYKLYDFTIMQGDKAVTVETEQKRGWTTSDGTFFVSGQTRSTVDVSGRKFECIADLFIMHNLSFDALCMTEWQNVLDAPMDRKNTNVGTRAEQFFKVPKELFQFYVLRAGVWQRV